jgi:hypothetical protein
MKQFQNVPDNMENQDTGQSYSVEFNGKPMSFQQVSSLQA